MDIDITDSAFSLDVPDFVNPKSSFIDLSSSYVYLAIATIIIGVGYFLYYYFKRNNQKMHEKREDQPDQYSSYDCPNGFCNMNTKDI